MTNMRLGLRTWIPFFVVAAGGSWSGDLAGPACAVEPATIEELQRVIEHQQRQLDAQQEQLDLLKGQLQELRERGASPAGRTGDPEVPVDRETPPRPLSPRETAVRVPAPSPVAQAAKYDRDNPTGSNITYFDPAKVINIPGTGTDIGLHGLVQFQIFHDTDGLDNNRFDTATIPVDGAPSQTKFNVNPSQLRLSSATSVPDGQINTMISMDFNGQLDRPEPRLRLAYGEFVYVTRGFGLLGGQAYATMLDLRAVPETLDFAMPAGLWQTRQPLLRLTSLLTQEGLMEVALETPENVTYEAAEELTRWPDLALAGTWLIHRAWIDHFRLSGLLRDLRAQGEDGSTDSALGWAVSLSTKVGLPFLGPRDNLKLTLHYGDGYGTQIKGGPSEGVFNPDTLSLEAIGMVGGYGGLQHFWSEEFRSNVVIGHVDAENPGSVAGDAFDNTSYTAVNLIWRPYESLDIGMEYLWGRRENKDGAEGTANRTLFSTRFVF